jgi:hypothetical protein
MGGTARVFARPVFAPGVNDVRVPDDAHKCVAFLGIRDEHGRFFPRATAFFARITDHQHEWIYLVTAEHVVSGLMTRGHDVWIRVNGKGGIVREAKFTPHLWSFGQPGENGLLTDVAVYRISVKELDILTLNLDGPNTLVMSEAEREEYDIGVGDQVAIAGLFRSHYGFQRNLSMTRIGHISMMAGASEPVSTKYCGYVEAYLIEAMSIGGLSGSPVFIHVGGPRMVRGQLTHPTKKGARLFYLLGLVHGHFDIKNLNEDVVSDDEKTSTGSIHSGIGIVIPTQKILETLWQPELMEMRKGIVDRWRAREGGVADLAIGDNDAPAANDDNPNYQEDFKRLLDVAVRKPKRED